MRNHPHRWWIGPSVPVYSFYKDDLWQRGKFYVFGVLIVSIVLLLLAFSTRKAEAQIVSPAYSVNQIVDAIYLAEGGSKTTHPYGILTHYKTTTPRQACINTVRHALKDWNGQGDFIEFLGKRYAPIGAKNDPRNLNKNWIRNVRYFLERLK